MPKYSYREVHENEKKFLKINNKDFVVEKYITYYCTVWCYLMVGRYDDKKIECITYSKILDYRNSITEYWWLLQEIDDEKYETFEEWCFAEITKEQEQCLYSDFEEYAVRKMDAESGVRYICRDLLMPIFTKKPKMDIDAYNRDKVIELIKIAPEKFEELSTIYSDDKEVALVAVRFYPEMIEHVSERLKDEIKAVLNDEKTKIEKEINELRKTQPSIEELCTKDFVIESLYKCPEIYNSLSDELKQDAEVKTALRSGIKSVLDICEELRRQDV